MKRLLVVAISTGLMAVISAQGSAQTRPNEAPPPVQAPPAMSDPGEVVLPTPQVEAASALKEQRTEERTEDGALLTAHEEAPIVSGKPPVDTHPLPPEVQRAAEASELPVITVRAQGAETVEEYRKHGKLYFVRVLSSSGPTKYYVDNPSAVPTSIMQQLSGPSGVVQPVYYNIADWK